MADSFLLATDATTKVQSFLNTIGANDVHAEGVSLVNADGTPLTTLAVTGTFFQATQPVSAASLPLPTGAATETTLGTRLAEATFTTRIPVNGQAAMGASMPVVIASNQSALPVTGTFWQATQPVSGTVTANAGSGTFAVSGTFFQATQPVSIAGNQATNTVQLGGVAVSLNTGVRDAGTQRVTIATNDVVPVSQSGSWSASSSQSGTWNITNISGTISLPTGAATETTLGTRLAESTFTTRIPVNGQGAMAASVPVVIASNQSAVPVSGSAVNPSTAAGKTITFVPVAQGAAGTTVLAGASPGNKHKIIGAVLTMSAAGTLKFTDGAGDLTGAMDVAATAGFVLPTSILPYQQTSIVNTALNLVTTAGLAKGVVVILTEP